MPEWFSGPYFVIAGVDTLGKRPRLGRGEIIAHKSGAVILRCPACAAVQFARADVLNDPHTPTLDRPIQCGSGHCKKCGVWFTIRNGEAKKVDEPTRPTRTLPKKLADAGVAAPPRLKV